MSTEDRKIFTLVGPEPNQSVRMEILVDGGPLCVASVWSWSTREKVLGLYFVYLKRLGVRFGPFYARIGLAEKAMRKILKEFQKPDFWTQGLEWYGRQETLHEWVDKNMGKSEDLVGGEWI